MNSSLSDLFILYESNDYIDKILEDLDNKHIKYELQKGRYNKNRTSIELIDYHYTIVFLKFKDVFELDHCQRAFEVLVENSLLEKLNETEIDLLSAMTKDKVFFMLGAGLMNTTNLHDYYYRNKHEKLTEKFKKLEELNNLNMN